MNLACIWVFALAAPCAVETAPGAVPPPPDPAVYYDQQKLTDALQSLVEKHPDACQLGSIGASRQSRDLCLLTLGRGTNLDRRPALAIVAGLDGDELGSTPIALRVAERLMNLRTDEAGGDLLDRLTIFVLPRLNPDAAAFFFATPRTEQRMALRPVDDDRDGGRDEDGPDDVNCDGIITWMRVRDPDATHLPDPAEPRLMKPADRAKGEKPLYKLYREGVDDDGDGEYNEDGLGGVDLNLNFMHGYEDHKPGAGPYAVSEPESRALIDFFLKHPRINAVIVYGRHDNLVKTPETGKTDVTGIAPSALHKDDQPIYEQLGKRYREITGVKEVPKEESAGSFYLWAYAQYGIPAFACRVWVCPEKSSKQEPPKPDAAKPDDKATAPPTTEEAKAPDVSTSEAKPPPPATAPSAHPPAPVAESGQSPPSSAPPPGESAPPSAAPETADKDAKAKGQADEPPKEKIEPADKEAAAWLAYSDAQCDGKGFMNWTPFQHPQLGAVEIGGFVPFFTTTPPPGELDTLAAKQLTFAIDVAQRLPQVRFEPVKVKALARNVFELQTAVVNDGYFPTALAMGRQNRHVRPIVLTLDVSPQRILGGQRVERAWSVAGEGGRQKLRWVVTGEPGEVITLTVTSEKFGDRQLEIPLVESPASQEDAP